MTVDRGSLPTFVPPPDWDVVLLCYVLAYLNPEEVVLALSRLRNETRPKALVFLEPEQPGEYGLLAERYTADVCGPPVWFHDYWTLLPETGWTIQWRWPLLPPTHRLRNIYVVSPKEDR